MSLNKNYENICLDFDKKQLLLELQKLQKEVISLKQENNGKDYVKKNENQQVMNKIYELIKNELLEKKKNEILMGIYNTLSNIDYNNSKNTCKSIFGDSLLSIFKIINDSALIDVLHKKGHEEVCAIIDASDLSLKRKANKYNTLSKYCKKNNKIEEAALFAYKSWSHDPQAWRLKYLALRYYANGDIITSKIMYDMLPDNINYTVSEEKCFKQLNKVYEKKIINICTQLTKDYYNELFDFAIDEYKKNLILLNKDNYKLKKEIEELKIENKFIIDKEMRKESVNSYEDNYQKVKCPDNDYCFTVNKKDMMTLSSIAEQINILSETILKK